MQLQNAHGSCDFSIDVAVTDLPGAPDNLHTTRVDENDVTVAWDEPHSDGGSNIFNYVIEKKDGV